jgi:glycolate oxidase iron-sulfur subunit
VKYDQLIEQTRAEIESVDARSLEDRWFRSALFLVLPHRTRLWLLALGLWLYRSIGLRWLLRSAGAFRKLPARFATLDRLAPSPSWRQLWLRLPRSSRASGSRRKRVTLLRGCVQDVYFPEVNQATLRVLRAEGCDVAVPGGLGCCGALSLHAGRESEARALAQRAIVALEAEESDAIVVNAAGCGSAMKHWARLFSGDAEWEARAGAQQSKVMDVSELLAELGAAAPRHPLRLKVAYHDACHLSHGQGVRSAPRELLRSIPELELVELPDADQCCGSAGIYNLLEPESASQIGQRKADSVTSVAPDVLVSANPGCTLQIQTHLGAGSTIRTAHPIQLIDASIRGARW